MVKMLGHVVLRVRNLERSLQFYREALGLREMVRHEDRISFLSAGEKHHDLALMEVGPDAPSPPAQSIGLYHIAFKVGDSLEELRAARDRLVAAGYAIRISKDHTVSQSLYLDDPDGITVELYVDASPQIWGKNPAAVASAKPLAL